MSTRCTGKGVTLSGAIERREIWREPPLGKAFTWSSVPAVLVAL
jgi:hypothetical protein